MSELEKPQESAEPSSHPTRHRNNRRTVSLRARIRTLGGLLRRDTHLHEVVRLAASAAMLRGVATALSFGTAVLLGRLLGAEGAGLYFFAVSVVNVTSSFGRAGFGNVLVRYIAESVAKKDWGTGLFVFKTSQRIVGGIAVVIGLALLLSAPWSAGAIFGKPEYEIPLMLAGIATVFYSLSWTVGDALRALRRIPAMQLVRTVISAIVTFVLLYPLIWLWGANGAIVAFVLSTVIALLIGYRLWDRAWRGLPGNTGESHGTSMTTRSLMMSSWALFGVGLANLGIQNLASVILGVWGTNADIGVFNVANRVAAVLQLPLFGVVSILAPKFVQLNAAGDMTALRSLVQRSCWLLLAVIGPAAAVVFVIAGPVMNIFGHHFESGVPILRILMIATVVNVVTGPTGILLIMCGREHVIWKLSLATLVIAVSLCSIATIYYGVIGLSAALVFALVMQNIVQFYLVKKHLGFWPVRLMSRRG